MYIVYPIIHRVLHLPGGWPWGFLNHQPVVWDVVEAENVAAAEALGFQGLLYDARKAQPGDLAKAGGPPGETWGNSSGFFSTRNHGDFVGVFVSVFFLGGKKKVCTSIEMLTKAALLVLRDFYDIPSWSFAGPRNSQFRQVDDSVGVEQVPGTLKFAAGSFPLINPILVLFGHLQIPMNHSFLSGFERGLDFHCHDLQNGPQDREWACWHADCWHLDSLHSEIRHFPKKSLCKAWRHPLLSA